METEDKRKFVVISTKIAAEEADKLDRIAEIDGCSKYDILQNLVAAYIRLKDPGTVITSEMNKLRIGFELDAKMEERLQLTDPTAEIAVREATYFVGATDKKNMRLVHVYEPFFGNAQTTENLQDILEETMAQMPTLYRKLRVTAVMMGANSLYELMLMLADEHDTIDDANFIEEQFADARRMDNGREMADAPYRRTMRNSMSAYEQKQARYEEWERQHQTELKFDDDEVINEVY